MAVAPQTGMDKAEMKRLLARSKSEPVNCAIGQGTDGSMALLMMDKIKAPKAVEKMLLDEFKGAKNTRFGKAVVDEETDPKLVKFLLNRAASGMARRLIKTLKGTGYSKVELCTEDGTPFESVAEEADGEGQEGETREAQGEDASEVPPAAPPPPVDLAGLRNEFTGLVKQIAAVTSGQAAELKQLAADAANAIRGSDGQGAEAAIGQIKEILSGLAKPTDPTANSKPSGSPDDMKKTFVQMQKSRLLWDSARKRVAGEIAGLKKAIEEEFEGDAEEATAMDAIDQLDEIVSEFDERLLDALDALLNETDPAKHAELLDEAREIIGEYASYADSNELLQKLNGDTPFGMKLSIGATLSATLKALRATVH